jgi:hypothetical protein
MGGSDTVEFTCDCCKRHFPIEEEVMEGLCEYCSGEWGAKCPHCRCTPEQATGDCPVCGEEVREYA